MKLGLLEEGHFQHRTVVLGIQCTCRARSAAVLSDIYRHSGVCLPDANGKKLNDKQYYCLLNRCIHYLHFELLDFQKMFQCRNELQSNIHPVEGYFVQCVELCRLHDIN